MKTKIRAVILIFLIIVIPLKQVEAGYWGEDLMTDFTIYTLDHVKDIIFQVASAQLQIIKIQTLNRFILQTISDVASPYIRNYEDFLYLQPNIKADEELETFLTGVLHGKTEANYTFSSDPDAGTTDNGSYEGLLRIAAIRGSGSQSRESTEAQGVTISDHCLSNQGEIQMFGDEVKPSFNCFSSVFANIHNHPEGIKIVAESARTKALERLKKEAENKAVSASGALGLEDEDGNVIKPGFAVENLMKESSNSIFGGVSDIKIEHPIAQAIVAASLPSLLKNTNKTLDKLSKRMTDRANDALKDIRADKFGNNPENQFRDGGLYE